MCWCGHLSVAMQNDVKKKKKIDLRKIFIDPDYFGNVMSTKRDIDWPSGAFYISLRVAVGWVLWIWISRTSAC